MECSGFKSFSYITTRLGQRQILYGVTYMWNPKKKKKEPIEKEKNGHCQRLGDFPGRYWLKVQTFSYKVIESCKSNIHMVPIGSNTVLYT